MGMPYIGFTKDIELRAKKHKNKLKLEYLPELNIITKISNKKEARKFENDLREQNGWQREGVPGGKVGGKTQGKNNVESGQIQALGKSQSQVEYTCPYCNKIGKGNYFKGIHLNKKYCQNKI